MNETTDVQLAVEGGALTVVAVGVVTLAVMRSMRRDIIRAVLSAEVKRVLIDASRAVMLMGPRSWAILAEEASAEHALNVPTAILVVAPMADLAWRYCDTLNQRGRIAVVFTHAPDAYWWVRGQQEQRKVSRSPRATPAPPKKAPRRRHDP